MGKRDDKKGGPVEAFVLRDCQFGQATQVVELDPADAEVAAAHGMVDLAEGAVAYGKSIRPESEPAAK